MITTAKAANDTPTATAVMFAFFATFGALLVAELIADGVVLSRVTDEVVVDEVVVDEVKEGSKMV